MRFDRSRELAVAERRRLVAELCVRGVGKRHSTREIAELLAKKGKTNPNGKPWSHQTIAADIQAVEAAWRQDAVQDIALHKAEILADYEELLRLHWTNQNYEGVRKVLKDKRGLLNTDSPDVTVFERVAQQMDVALERLQDEFRNEPELLHRAFGALMGKQDREAPRSYPN